MKTTPSIHELFAAAVELSKQQAMDHAANVKGMDMDLTECPKCLSEETDEISPGFYLVKREMWSVGEWYYEVQLNTDTQEGEVRTFCLYVEMLEYLRDVAEILARRIDPFWVEACDG